MFDLAKPPPIVDVIDGLIVIAPSTIDERFFHQLLVASQALVPQLSRPGFYLTISRLDGQFGLAKTSSPLSAGLHAFSKTIAREFPDIFCRCLDVAVDCHDYRQITSELLFASHQEIGHDGTISGYLTTTAPLNYPTVDNFADNQLFLFSGGGRGITYRLAEKFLAQTDNRALLVGSSPAPQPEPLALQGLVDEPAIKHQLMLDHPGLTPRNIEDKYRVLLKNRQLRDNLSKLTSRYRDRLSYRQLDVCDRQAVAELASEPITALVHGAGILHDRWLVDLKVEDFQRVYAPKVQGLQNLLEHIDPSRLQYLVIFSSLTARHGRQGQLAYAVANEIINKQAQQLQQRYPELKVVSFNFGPWQGEGMVSPLLEKLFADEGLGLIPSESGTELCIREIFASDKRGVERLVFVETPTTTKVFNYNLNEQPFLNSHRINKKITLPLALIIQQIYQCQQAAVLKQIKVVNGVSFDDCYRLQLQRTATEIVLSDYQDRCRYRATLVDMVQPPAFPELTIASNDLLDKRLYGTVLFHGQHFQLLDDEIFAGQQGLQTMIKFPADKLTAMYAVDVLLQLAIVYTHHQYQALSLPMAIDYSASYRQLQTSTSYCAALVGRQKRQASVICDAELSCETELYVRLQGIEMIFLPNQ